MINKCITVKTAYEADTYGRNVNYSWEPGNIPVCQHDFFGWKNLRSLMFSVKQSTHLLFIIPTTSISVTNTTHIPALVLYFFHHYLVHVNINLFYKVSLLYGYLLQIFWANSMLPHKNLTHETDLQASNYNYWLCNLHVVLIE